MNKLVIIGNGFDLAHGLKTRYSDFMLWYLKRSLEIAIKKGRHEDKLISLSTAHSKYRKTFQINHLKDFKPEINSVKYSLKESGFLKLLLENADDYNWVDIESEYYKSLVYWYNEIQLADKRVKKLHNIQLLSLNESLNCIKKNLIEYLNSLELEMVQKNQTISNHIDELMESIKKRNENAPFSESQICFLNFNYTSIIDTYLKKYNTSEYNFSVINIHGNLKDMDSIIFGYGDLIDSNYENLENAHNNEYLKHVKHFYYFQRQKFHELIRF
ncbi:MAG: AbiH family protein, partial [Bacteroidota bacterium]|nr:AbiH family protein [Bacteroidota bacterium]